MQPHEVSAIQRDHGPLIGYSQFKNGPVGERLPSIAGVGNGDHVVPDSTECFNNGVRKVLVGEEARHERYALSLSLICRSISSRCVRT